MIALSVSFENIPRVPKPRCHVVDQVEDRFWHLAARFGFFEIPDLRRALSEASRGCTRDGNLEQVIFIGTRDLVIYKEGSSLLRRASAHGPTPPFSIATLPGRSTASVCRRSR